MIKTIIKRDGTKQDFEAEKLNGWGEWAASVLGRQVNWGDVVLNTVATLPEVSTAVQLQDGLIDQCLSRKTWAYNRMAGRLYASTLYKVAFDDKGMPLDAKGFPSIKDLHKLLTDKTIMSPIFHGAWSDEEYEEINNMLRHELDLTYPHYQLKQICEKYSLKDKTKNEMLFETPQFVYMRVAMRMAMNKKNRMELIRKFYKYYSENKINIPTPYFSNSGTHEDGFSSCCLYMSSDDVKSIGAGLEIAYTMTYSSAGIGAAMQTRSQGAPIRGGIIAHSGKVPYYRALVGMIKANLKNGRGGAATVTYDCYDPDVQVIQPLKNSMTPASKQVRGIDYSMAFNTFLAKRAAQNKDIALFDIAEAPEIYEALADGDDSGFEALYEKAVTEGRYKKIVKARDVLLGALTEAIETGRHYYTNLTEANRHTPFVESIIQSNLCLTGDTEITVRPIGLDANSEMVVSMEKFVELFDRDIDWEVLSVSNDGTRSWHQIENTALMGLVDELIEIEADGKVIRCTPDHKIMTKNRGWVKAEDLVETDELVLGS